MNPELPRPSARTLRINSFASEFARLTVTAERAGIDPAQVVLPAEGIVRARDGVGLHYLEWPGPVPDPMLLFLHGGGLHAHSYDAAALLLRDVGRCVSMDLRGHGDSEWAGERGYSSLTSSSDIAAVTESLGARRVVVVAHSLGGIAAMVWASQRPPVLAGLVVVDVGPDIEQAGSREVGELIMQRPMFPDLETAEEFVSGVGNRPRGPGTSGVVDNLIWTDDGMLTWKHDIAQFAAATVSGTEVLRDACLQISCPTLVLRGERSRVFTVEGAQKLAALIPGARWEQVPDAGHTIQKSNPRGLADAVTRFVAGC